MALLVAATLGKREQVVRSGEMALQAGMLGETGAQASSAARLHEGSRSRCKMLDGRCTECSVCWRVLGR